MRVRKFGFSGYRRQRFDFRPLNVIDEQIHETEIKKKTLIAHIEIRNDE